jgi:hypothetical protein
MSAEIKNHPGWFEFVYREVYAFVGLDLKTVLALAYTCRAAHRMMYASKVLDYGKITMTPTQVRASEMVLAAPQGSYMSACICCAGEVEWNREYMPNLVGRPCSRCRQDRSEKGVRLDTTRMYLQLPPSTRFGDEAAGGIMVMLRVALGNPRGRTLIRITREDRPKWKKVVDDTGLGDVVYVRPTEVVNVQDCPAELWFTRIPDMARVLVGDVWESLQHETSRRFTRCIIDDRLGDSIIYYGDYVWTLVIETGPEPSFECNTFTSYMRYHPRM